MRGDGGDIGYREEEDCIGWISGLLAGWCFRCCIGLFGVEATYTLLVCLW